MVYSRIVNLTLEVKATKRDNLSLAYIDVIRFLERTIENMISIEVDKGTYYKEIYQICKAKCDIIKELPFLPLFEANSIKITLIIGFFLIFIYINEVVIDD